MFELVAYYLDEEFWREAIANGEEKKLGSIDKEDVRVPEEFRSDFVAPDPAISGWHVTLQRQGERLLVWRRLEPRPTRNPVLFKDEPVDEFELDAGDEFSIADAPYIFKWEKTEIEAPGGMTLRYSQPDLKKKGFGQSGIEFDSLKELSNLSQVSTVEQVLARIVKLLVQKLPGAKAAALMERTGFEQTMTARVREPANLPFPFNKHLLNEALDKSFSALSHDYRDAANNRDFSLKETGINWAVIAPVPNSEARLALYVVGNDDRTKGEGSMTSRKQSLEQAVMFLDLAASVLGNVMQNRRLEIEKKRLLNFPPKQFKKLLRLDDDAYRLETEPRVCPVTVFFCDLRGFSQFAEDNADDLRRFSQQVLKALNEITKCVVAHDGVIGDLQGDAVMAFWGWPGSVSDQVIKAAKAARDVAFAFAQGSELRAIQFSCGVGLAHGDALVGLMEVAHQAKINIYGPVVNRASRLESLTKRFKVQILVDEGVKKELEKKPGDIDIAFRSFPKVRLAGMTQPSQFFELYQPDESSHEDRPAANFWERALQCFTDGDWPTARDFVTRAFQNRRLECASDAAAQWLLHYMEQNTPKPGDKHFPSLEK
ncbi:MAG: adenylate/guanylate cyclase domain-containing protein [Planctomycetes bacterium]|nr:adenylate/guanylate cyclase domain-containing protein [Planctomycetota bacterium]